MPKVVLIYDSQNPHTDMRLALTSASLAMVELDKKMSEASFLDKCYTETCVNGVQKDTHYYEAQYRDWKINREIEVRKGLADFYLHEGYEKLQEMKVPSFVYFDDNAVSENVFGEKVSVYSEILLGVFVDYWADPNAIKYIEEISSDI